MSASTPLPECNYCGSQYDPYDIHTCAGNQIYPRFKRTVKPVELPKPCPATHEHLWSGIGPEAYCIGCDEKLSDHQRKMDGAKGLTRQQIGEALDADRAASSVGESALDEMIDRHALELRQNTVRTRIETLTGVASALNTQAGGDHYRKMKIQPVEYIIANDIGFLPGNIIKYASRYPEKGGAEDIRKIIHYCKLILEFEYGERNGG